MNLVIAEFGDTRCPLCHRAVFAGTRHECHGGPAITEPLRKPAMGTKPIPRKEEQA